MKKAARKPDEAPTTEAAPEGSNADNEGHLTLAEVKELIELVSEKEFNEFELKRGSFRLRIVARNVIESTLQAVSTQPVVVESGPIEIETASARAVHSASAPGPEQNLHLITSPIVGTFYRASSPTAEPYVKLGDSVEAGTTLCIIEAMKLMNEIPSDVSGEVAKIFVENGQPVEFGQPLFGLKV